MVFYVLNINLPNILLMQYGSDWLGAQGSPALQASTSAHRMIKNTNVLWQTSITWVKSISSTHLNNIIITQKTKLFLI